MMMNSSIRVKEEAWTLRKTKQIAPWKRSGGLEAPTTAFDPEAVKHAVTTFKAKMTCRIQNWRESHDVEAEARAWKALIAADALLSHVAMGLQVDPGGLQQA